MSLLKARIPAIVVTSIICLGLGALAGACAMTMFGYHSNHPAFNPLFGEQLKKSIKRADVDLAGSKPKAKKGGPTSIDALVSLVAKLDELNQKPLKVELDKKQQQEVAEQLQGLAELKELTEEDAKKRLDALLKVVAGHQETLEMAGFRWPGKEPRPANMNPNPFQEEANRKHLEGLGNRKVN